MGKINFQQAKFLISAADIQQFPEDIGAEVAFVGRSNAGKSSALNTLVRQKNLARTSKTPGRTQLINFFTLNDQHRFVDLPGYGYAKVPEKVKRHWHHLIDEYLQCRKSLKGLVLLMDIRHPLQPFDWQMIEWSSKIEMPIHILLTKSDKLKKGAALNELRNINKELMSYSSLASTQLFSAVTKTGLEDLEKKLSNWLVF